MIVFWVNQRKFSSLILDSHFTEMHRYDDEEEIEVEEEHEVEVEDIVGR